MHRKSVVCFYADGKTKYHEMTKNAVISFLKHSTIPSVGVLVPNLEVEKEFRMVVPLEFSSRVHYKNTSLEPHLAHWNPTQYKLDIALFADEFDFIFWMDADTFTISNIDPFFQEVHNSNYKMWFIPDHSLEDPVFCSNWKETFAISPFVPQACFMGFSSVIIKVFFEIWKSKWQQWIFPSPFVSHPDPRPHFNGSEFCIEQYALGNTIEQFERDSYSSRQEIFIIPRTVLIVTSPDNNNTTQNNNNNNRNEEIQHFSTSNTSYPFTRNSSLPLLSSLSVSSSYFACHFSPSQLNISPSLLSHLSLLQLSPSLISLLTSSTTSTVSSLSLNSTITMQVYQELLQFQQRQQSQPQVFIVDNVLSGSFIHTFGVNYQSIRDGFFSDFQISESLRNEILKDFSKQREHRLKMRLNQLFENDLGKDHRIYLNSGVLFVHSPIIQIQCPKLLESSSVEDVDSNVNNFQIFLKLIYMCDVEDDSIDISNIIELILLSIKFGMRILSDILKLKLWNLCDGNLEFYTKHIHSLPYFYKNDNTNTSTPSSHSSHNPYYNNPHYSAEPTNNNPHFSAEPTNNNPHCTNTSEPAFSATSLFEELFLLKETTADFSICLTSNEEIKVHKWVLSQWDFFTEKIISFNYEYENEIPVSTFKKLVQYYYTDDVSIFNFDDCTAIIEKADYFMIDSSLRNYCYHFLRL
jgi:hypothetical protein